MEKKNEDYDFAQRGRSPFGSNGGGGGLLSGSHSRRAQQESFSAKLSQVNNSPGTSVISYCFSSISMTVVNKYVVSGQSWNLNFFYLAVQARLLVLLSNIHHRFLRT